MFVKMKGRNYFLILAILNFAIATIEILFFPNKLQNYLIGIFSLACGTLAIFLFIVAAKMAKNIIKEIKGEK